jgi:hypothetical protein
MDPDRELRLVTAVLASQPTDEEMIQLEHEDIAPLAQEVEFDVEPELMRLELTERELSTKKAPTVKRGAEPAVVPRPVMNVPPPFLNSEPWIDASRWARVVGHWTLANRVFLWEYGDKLRNGKEPSEADRARAAALWSDAQRQGFVPKLSSSSAKN